MTEAWNLQNMVAAQTPLLGDENAPLHLTGASGTSFESSTPQHQVSFTLNPLATPYRAADPLSIGATPRDPSGRFRIIHTVVYSALYRTLNPLQYDSLPVRTLLPCDRNV